MGIGGAGGLTHTHTAAKNVLLSGGRGSDKFRGHNKSWLVGYLYMCVTVARQKTSRPPKKPAFPLWTTKMPTQPGRGERVCGEETLLWDKQNYGAKSEQSTDGRREEPTDRATLPGPEDAQLMGFL